MVEEDTRISERPFAVALCMQGNQMKKMRRGDKNGSIFFTLAQEATFNLIVFFCPSDFFFVPQCNLPVTVNNNKKDARIQN
jgi:hypothetical protein